MPHRTTKSQTTARILLGIMLITAALGHFTFARRDFQAQVPDWVPMEKDDVVLLSGIPEVALGISLIFLRRYRIQVGWIIASFFVLVFPGNISQYVNHRSAFGLDTDLRRGLRLLMQPVLVVWALWACGVMKKS